MKKLIDKLHQEQMLSAEEFRTLLTERSEETDLYARELADQVRQQVYGDAIYVRGLIEFTNYCKNDCYYCGIRRSNRNAQRYRLTEEDIFACCREGYELGFRTFVLQGGEDGYYTDEKLVSLIRGIKEIYPDCALTLSIGEKSEESYRAYREAGLTVIFFGMKLHVRNITESFIRQKCPVRTAGTVFVSLRNWGIRRGRALW